MRSQRRGLAQQAAGDQPNCDRIQRVHADAHDSGDRQHRPMPVVHPLRAIDAFHHRPNARQTLQPASNRALGKTWQRRDENERGADAGTPKSNSANRLNFFRIHPPHAAGENCRRANNKQCVQSDQAVDHDCHRRFGAPALVAMRQKHGFEQIASHASRSNEVVQVAEEPEAEGIAKRERNLQSSDQKIPAHDGQRHRGKAQHRRHRQQIPLLRRIAHAAEAIVLRGIHHEPGDDRRGHHPA